MGLLYRISDAVYFFLYYLIPYRKELVYKNLRNSFPEWNDKHVRDTAKRFYRFLCDFFMESALLITLDEKVLLKRFRFRNPELLNELFNEGKSVILVLGHYANWEWAASIPKFVRHQCIAVYRPLHFRFIDRIFINARERFGIKAIPSDNIARVLNEYRREKILNLSFFVADQRPLMKNIQYWTTLLNQDTPIVLGPEKLAIKMNLAVVYFQVKRIKRGYYESEFILITDNAGSTSEYEISEKFVRLLEKQVIKEPAYWLWTHNRWKHNKDEYYRRYGERESHRRH